MPDASISEIGWKPNLTFPDRLHLVRVQYAERTGKKIGVREMADLVGVPMQTWSAWERGSRAPRNPVPIAQKVAAITGGGRQMLDWLLGSDEFEPGPVDDGPVTAVTSDVNRRSRSTRWYSVSHLDVAA